MMKPFQVPLKLHVSIQGFPFGHLVVSLWFTNVYRTTTCSLPLDILPSYSP